MTNEEAKTVLLTMECTVTPHLVKGDRMQQVRLTRTYAAMEGYFSAQKLEAIAQWMRDPKGVAEA